VGGPCVRCQSFSCRKPEYSWVLVSRQTRMRRKFCSPSITTLFSGIFRLTTINPLVHLSVSLEYSYLSLHLTLFANGLAIFSLDTRVSILSETGDCRNVLSTESLDIFWGPTCLIRQIDWTNKQGLISSLASFSNYSSVLNGLRVQVVDPSVHVRHPPNLGVNETEPIDCSLYRGQLSLQPDRRDLGRTTNLSCILRIHNNNNDKIPMPTLL
jgi:hypothetical protein